MIVLDAYGLVALLGEEHAAAEVEAILRSNDAAMTATNLAEALDVATRVHGIADEDLHAIVEPLLDTSITVLQSSSSEAWRAAQLRSRHYDRTRRAVSVPDCILVAHAGVADSVATADPGVAGMARDEGVHVIALPDRAGRRPL